jgi:PAS domain S-box-containing protein
LRILYDTINAGIIFEDVDGVVLRANRMATDILDLDEDELIGNNLIDVLGEVVDAQGIGFGVGEHPLMKTQATGEPVHNVILGLLPNDPIRKRWIFINTEPIVDAVTGKLDEILVTFVDFTEQKQIEEALIESEERYRHMFEQCPIGVGISTLDGQVITANRAMQEITGYSLDEFRQINIADTYENVEDRRRLLQALNQYGRVTDYRVRLKRKDGKSYDAILNISRINLGGKDYLHTMCQPAASRKSK